MRQGAMMLLAIFGAAGCGPSASERRATGTTAEAAIVKPAASGEHHGDPAALTAEQLEEVDHFFHRKMGQLQFRCYQEPAEKNQKKAEGHLSLSLLVQPGGKASDVKITGSSLNSPSLEQCVISEIQGWEWPSVPATVPYSSAINFKPAW